MQSAIIVHGGAGAWKEGSERMEPALEACREAALHAQQLLLKGASALDAVEAATRILEDCPVLDAGRGSYPTQSGSVEMDALIMDGETLDMGAVGAIELVRNPISLARHIMCECEHAFLVGRGADAFAEEIKFPRCRLEDLLTRPTNDGKQDARRQQTMGTVGAVARDTQGNLAAAVSTGGTANKRSGRLGDSPLVGSGAYADNWTAAATATGYGEALMKVVISRRVCEFVAAGLPAREACQAAIRLLEHRVQGQGGIIAIDARGNVGHAFNTEAMPYAYTRGNEPVQSGK
jgi:beta-aspartyl-peptidase (threonine type)